MWKGYTYKQKQTAYAILTTGQEAGTVTIPDQVANNQREYDGWRVISQHRRQSSNNPPVRTYGFGRVFTVIFKNGNGTAPAILRGDMYGLWTGRRGNPVVQIIKGRD